MFSASILLALSLHADPAEKRFDLLAEQARKDWDVPGLALVVVSREGIVHLGGYGPRQLGKPEPITPDTLFPLASCTKSFTTTLAAMLADEKKWNWDDPVRKYLPDFRLSDPAADALVTLRDLGSHRTGVAAHDLLWYRSPFTQKELVARVPYLPLSRPFRKDLQYQTVMYIALGQAIERAAGQSWSDLMTARILEPLGMKSTCLTSTDALRTGRAATGHRQNRDGQIVPVPDYEQKEPNPAGSAYSSVRDLAPWLQLHIQGGTFKDTPLVSTRNLEETHQPHTIVPVQGEARRMHPETHQISYALAWVALDYRGELVVMHAGLIDGFRAHLTLLPKRGHAFAILANREATRMNLALSYSIIDSLLGLPAREWNRTLLEATEEATAQAQVQARRIDLARNPARRPDLPLADLAGTYEEPAYGPSKIRLNGDQLIWEWGSWKLPLEHYSGNTFRLTSESDLLHRAFLSFEVTDGQTRGYRLLDLNFARK